MIRASKNSSLRPPRTNPSPICGSPTQGLCSALGSSRSRLVQLLQLSPDRLAIPAPSYLIDAVAVAVAVVVAAWAPARRAFGEVYFVHTRDVTYPLR